MNSIEIKHLTKEYDNFKIKDLNLEIPSGQIMGLIGENGAGKTTLIKNILNIIDYDGEIKIFNKEVKKYEKIIKEDIGVVLDNSFFPDIMDIKDIKKIMRQVYKNWDDNLFNKLLIDFKINTNQKLKTLSKGMKKKLEIATSLAHHPKLLILDEPTSGLDPIIRSEILDIFVDFVKDEEHTIFLSTHITSDLEHIADNITFIDNGSIVFNKNKDDILKEYGIIKCDEKTYLKIDKKDIEKTKKIKNDYEILVMNKKEFNKKYKSIEIKTPTLDDIMLLYIKGE